MIVAEGQKTSRFQQLQQAAGRVSPETLERELDLLEIARDLMPPRLDLTDLHPQLLERLGSEAD